MCVQASEGYKPGKTLEEGIEIYIYIYILTKATRHASERAKGTWHDATNMP